MPTNNNLSNLIGHLGGEEHIDNSSSELLSEADVVVENLEAQENEHGKTGLLGTKIMTQAERHKAMASSQDTSFRDERKLTRIGETIGQNVEAREGWSTVDRTILGDRNLFYPESWEFMIRPANVDAIKNWSTIQEEDATSVNTVFNEILKACLSIRDTATGAPVVWSQINTWDRFFFVLLIHDYTFQKGEANIEYDEECPECDNDVKFTLTTGSLDYDMPDAEVLKYWDREERCWVIDTDDFGLVNRGVLRLYAPTLEKDANLIQYIQDQYQTKGKISREFEIFLKYLIWLLPKASKDQTILKRAVREAEMEFKGWSMEEFLFIDDVVRNVQITPSTRLRMKCPTCGEEVTAPIRFPNGIKSLFAVTGGFKKFGSK